MAVIISSKDDRITSKWMMSRIRIRRQTWKDWQNFQAGADKSSIKEDSSGFIMEDSRSRSMVTAFAIPQHHISKPLFLLSFFIERLEESHWCSSTTCRNNSDQLTSFTSSHRYSRFLSCSRSHFIHTAVFPRFRFPQLHK